jgi:myo-inositol 2-dehydrogenase/D-chiro-inositol 1-dehydrogenase
MLRIGILGAGRIGQVHARTLKQLDVAKAVAVSDAFEAPAKALADSLGAKVMTTDEIIASKDIDAVIIGTPTDTHFDIIQAAAKAGKAIFCEKPVDLSTDRIRQCLEVVEKANVPFMTAFNRRFDPNFAYLENQIRTGAIGNVEMISILSRDPSPPPVNYIKSSGGIFRDMMIHDLDMARFLLGEDPIEIFAVGSCLVDPEIGEAGDVDTAAATLKTASGKICTITCSRRATYGYDQRVEVHGSQGMLRAHNVHENTVEIANADGFKSAVVQNFFLERYADAYRNELLHFVEAINAGKAPMPNGEDGLKAQQLADAAALSLQEQRPVLIQYKRKID